MFGIEHRNLTDELMDDPALDVQSHQRALNGLRRINVVTGAYRPIVREVLKLGASQQEPISVLDIACGGGDLLCAIQRAASRAGVPVRLSGHDISAEAVRIATANANASAHQITFNVGDVFDMDQSNTYDVVCCSLFLHHLTWEKAVEFLRLMQRASKRMVLVADLKRTVLGYFYSLVGPRLLTTSGIVHVDGIKSVRGAFSMNEVRRLIEEAEMENAELVNFWPQRFLLRWRKEAVPFDGQ